MPRIDEIETPRIPVVSVIDQIRTDTVVEVIVPVTTYLAPPVVDVPAVEMPTYEPPNYDPEQIIIEKVNSGDKEEESESESPSRSLPAPTRPEITIPGTNTVVPLPTQREVTLAGTTAIGATAAALMGKSLVEQLLKIFKPIAKTAMVKAKVLFKKDLTPYELQTFLEFEGTKEFKKLTLKLKKEYLKEKTRQASEWAASHEQQHHHKSSHTVIEDES